MVYCRDCSARQLSQYTGNPASRMLHNSRREQSHFLPNRYRPLTSKTHCNNNYRRSDETSNGYETTAKLEILIVVTLASKRVAAVWRLGKTQGRLLSPLVVMWTRHLVAWVEGDSVMLIRPKKKKKHGKIRLQDRKKKKKHRTIQFCRRPLLRFFFFSIVYQNQLAQLSILNLLDPSCHVRTHLQLYCSTTHYNCARPVVCSRLFNVK